MAQMTVDFLDVGPTKYGDCILVRGAGKAILIDGAHSGDMRDKEGFTSIPGQLDALFGTARPHAIDLLIVTHAHADHIGCLPALVGEGVIACRTAYVADERLAWFPASDAGGPDAPMLATVDALREEGALMLGPDALQQAIADAIKLRESYGSMLTALESNGTVIRCTGQENRAALEQQFSALGLRILGPTRGHLTTCAAQVEHYGRDVMKALVGVTRPDGSSAIADLVHEVTTDSEALVDQFGAGSALNDQSLVVVFEFGGRKVLLPGDMQFADHQVTGLDAEMQALRAVVKAHGPYDIIKTPHHTSYNGWDKEVGDEQVVSSRAVYLVHTGGRNDAKHPEDGALSAIRKLRQERSKSLTFLRTDRNGAISFTVSSTGRIEVTKQRGRSNDFRPNTDESVSVPSGIGSLSGTPLAPSSVATSPVTSSGVVEIIARVPHTSTRVTLTIDVAPGQAQATVTPTTSRLGPGATLPAPGRQPGTASDPPTTFSVPTDRTLPPLLFLTDATALARKIGSGPVESMVNALVNAQQTVLNVEASGVTPRQIADAVRQHMAGVKGVVLIGDIDVMPSERLDVLPPEVRRALSDPDGDPDHFVVWSDEVYGCQDGDDIAELPVSRIPDGGSAETLARALRASSGNGAARFGIRNIARPFADVIFKHVARDTALKVSAPTQHADLRPTDVGADLVYIMLHGSDADTRRFWGESTTSGYLEAINLAQVPARFNGVVLAGCCWGALTASHKALDAASGARVVGRSADDSLAVAFIHAGARAFVGCTGVHYSPPGKTIDSAGAPMHRAFLSALASGEAPAMALFNAKRTCLGQLRRAGSVEEFAIGLKIIRQFTCLGLGW